MMKSEFPGNGLYPRALSELELDWLRFVLPQDRPGYQEYLERIRGKVVLGEGRRGKGNLILGERGLPDRTSPLQSVVAFGAIETTDNEITVSVRKFLDDQVEVEFMCGHGDGIPSAFIEQRRWTYSTWSPGTVSPRSGKEVREVTVTDSVTLALSAEDKRIWAYESGSGMNFLIPITAFYGELMVSEGIRDPQVALKPSRFFGEMGGYSDVSVRESFLAYNRRYPKVPVAESGRELTDRSWRKRIMGLLGLEISDV